VAQVRQSFIEVARVLDLDAKIVLVPRPPLCKVRRMLKVPSLAAHADCCIKIERQLVSTAFRGSAAASTLRFSFDEIVKPRSVFKFRVGVEKECRVI
jgi:hypothetical protein